MKIRGEIPRISAIYDKQKSVGKVGKTCGTASKKDVLSISGQAKDYQTAMKAVRDIPDIRRDKVNELSARFESDSYDVHGKDIANKVIKSIIDRKA